MPSPAGSFKVAQEAALRAASAVTAAMGGKARLYTEVPANAQLPYAVLGDDQVLLQSNDGCADSAELISTIGVWSRKVPLDKGVEARAIGAAMIDALNLQLTVAGWDVDDWQVTSERYVTDPDQSTHGILVFRYLLTQQVA